MPVQHHLCFSLGCQSQQHLLVPSKGGRRQPGWGGSKLSSAVATPGPTLTSFFPPLHHQELGKNKTRLLRQQYRGSFRGAKHLNSTEGLISNKLLSHVDSLMADKELRLCCAVVYSRGDSVTASLPILSLGTCGHSAAGTLHF